MAKTYALAVWAAMALAGAGMTMTGATPAVADDQPKELAMAVMHAGLAAAAKDLGMVHVHLHHTVNCLVGPGGSGYDASQLNPCKDLGKGVLADSPAGDRNALQAAVEHAQAGLMTDDLPAAQKISAETQAMLKAVKD